KTTLAKVLERHLTSKGHTVKYITLAHWKRTEFPDLLHNNDAFDAFWKNEIQCTWSECTKSKDPIFILIDEAQVLYNGNGSLDFWTQIKYFTDHPKNGLHVLLLSMYESQNAGSAILNDSYTPIDFINPMGLDELHLNENEFKDLTSKFIEYIDKEEDTFIMPDDMLKSVYSSTRRHPHLRMRVFDWMTNWKPTEVVVDTIFLKMAYDMVDDDSTFVVDTKTAEMQEALRRLMHSGLVTYSGRSWLQFAAPVVQIIMGQHLYAPSLTLESDVSFEAFLQTSIKHMRPSELHKSLSYGIDSQLLERAWQKAWLMAASTAIPSGHTISPDVGRIFGSSGFLDFYINGGLKWEVELMQEGRRMGDHVDCFRSTGRPNSKKLDPNVWYALYADDYSTMTIIRHGKDEMLLTLRGDDPQLFPKNR
ncbi:7469_t:CDS:2, partial [Paraglomus occultum]